MGMHHEDEVNYYIISMCPPEIQRLFLASIHHVLHHGPPSAWAKARMCLLYKKGDAQKASNYRPICLIQSLLNLRRHGNAANSLSSLHNTAFSTSDSTVG